LLTSGFPGLNPAQTALTHTPKHVPFPAADASTTSSATKRGASASSSAARADKDKPSPTKVLAFPRIIRRVQAVVEVPVKEEEEDREAYLEPGISRPDTDPDADADADTTTAVLLNHRPATTPIGNGGSGGGGGRGEARRRKSSVSSHRRRSLVAPSDDRSYGYVDGEEPPSDESDDDDDGGGEYVDEEEVENAIANGDTPATTRTTIGGRKTVPWGRKHIRHEPDDEDDELMMYARVRIFPPSFFRASCIVPVLLH
jgi:hypothetical protein